MASLTKHGEKRIRKRAGIPRRATQKLVDEAKLKGKPASEFKGSFRRYLDFQGITYNTTPVVYNGYIYFFHGNLLTTMWPIPQSYRKVAK